MRLLLNKYYTQEELADIERDVSEAIEKTGHDDGVQVTIVEKEEEDSE